MAFGTIATPFATACLGLGGRACWYSDDEHDIPLIIAPAGLDELWVTGTDVR